MVHVPDIILPPTLVAVVQLSTPVFSIYCSSTLALLLFSSIPLLMQSVVRLQRQQALVRSVIAKEKKTRGHGTCFLSYEIDI